MTVPFVIQAIFRVVWEVWPVFPTVPQFWPSPGALVVAKRPTGLSPKDAALPAPEALPAAGDFARSRRSGSSVQIAPGCATWGMPQQALLLEAVAMLVRVAPPKALGHLGDASIGLAVPQKPTLARVTWLIGGPMTQHTEDRHFQVSCFRQMQPVHKVISTGWPFASLPCHLPEASPYILGLPH